jgi:hypothetical protein
MATLVHSELYFALLHAGVSTDIAGVVAHADPRVPSPNLTEVVTMLQAVLLKLDTLDKRLQAVEQRLALSP